MKISYKVTTECKFSVEYFWSNEGGMGNDVVRAGIDTLEEAIEVYNRALDNHDMREHKNDLYITTQPIRKMEKV